MSQIVTPKFRDPRVIRQIAQARIELETPLANAAQDSYSYNLLRIAYPPDVRAEEAAEFERLVKADIEYIKASSLDPKKK